MNHRILQAILAVGAFALAGFVALAESQAQTKPSQQGGRGSGAQAARPTGKKPVASAPPRAGRAAAPAPKPAAKSASVYHNPGLPTKLPPKVKKPDGAEANAALAKNQEMQGTTDKDAMRNILGGMRSVRAYGSTDNIQLGETLGIALDGQFLLIPLEFVSELALSGHDARFAVDEPAQAARLVDLDLAANLALLKTDKPLVPYFPREKIRTDLPANGEVLVTIVTKDWFRPGARLISIKQEGEVTRLQIAQGGTGADWNGFLIDRSGRLVSYAGQAAQGSRLWVASTRAIWELLVRQTTPKPASVMGLEDRRRQLIQWQDRWTQLVSPVRGTINVQGLSCRNHSLMVADASLAARIGQAKAVACETEAPLSLGSGYFAGVQVRTGSVSLVGANATESQSASIAETFASELFSEQAKQASLVNLMTGVDCKLSKVANRKGTDVQVKFCTSALKAEQSLNDTVIAVSSLSGGTKANVAAVRLKGFSQTNTKQVLEALVENVGGAK